MKQIVLSLAIFCACLEIASAQTGDVSRITDSIETEGKTLYKSETASWYGTDIFLARFKNKQSRRGGYISYDTGKGMNNIFFSNDPEPVVLATMSFPYNVKPENCKIDSTERKFSDMESQLYRIRKIALTSLLANKDSIFRFYRNTGINPIPIIINGQNRVYILTSPHENGQVLFGNDYLLTFDKNDQITATKRFHKSLITISYRKSPSDTSHSAQVAAVHNHLKDGDQFITATDICTLMLYEKFTTWQEYIVITPTYASIWDCKTNHLSAINMEAWNKLPDKDKLNYRSK